jgi:gamma-glutamyl phosphate reductase
VAKALAAAGVELRAETRARKIRRRGVPVVAATTDDFGREFST